VRYLTLLLALVLAAPVPAQDTTQARLDSLQARLAAIEERLAIVQQQAADEAALAVRTKSRIALEFRGKVLLSGVSNSGAVNNTDYPSFVRPRDPAVDPRGIALVMRQTMLGGEVRVRDVLGGQFTGDLDVDFAGGQQASYGGRTFPLLRLRTARAILDWTHGQLLVGQETPLIADLNPVSVAGVATPLFTSAGNLWLWIPQIRATVQTAGPVRVGLQGAVLTPSVNKAVPSFDVPDFDAGERTRRPYVQGRLRAQWGEAERPGEIGVGIHRGWVQVSNDTERVSEALAADALIPLTGWLEVRGEYHDSRGASPLGGGAIGQLFGADQRLVRTRAGWGQVNVQFTPSLLFSAGMGIDDPEDADAPVDGRLRNVVQSTGLIWRPAGPLLAGLEYRSMTTRYAAGDARNHHVHLTLGFEF
jgi:hypothetical protein